MKINNQKNNSQIKFDAGVYAIQCLDCKKKKYGCETSWKIQKLIYKHEKNLEKEAWIMKWLDIIQKITLWKK